jgi:hypothetical protein
MQLLFHRETDQAGKSKLIKSGQPSAVSFQLLFWFDS